LEKKLADSGLVLLPEHRTHASGKPLFRVLPAAEEGVKKKNKGVLFYADEGVVYVSQGGAVGDSEGSWHAIGVPDLIKLLS
jgi:hypothetical protein